MSRPAVFKFEMTEELFQDLSDIPGVDPFDEFEDALRLEFLKWLRAWRDLEQLKKEGYIQDYKLDGDSAFIVPMAAVDFIEVSFDTPRTGIEFKDKK